MISLDVIGSPLLLSFELAFWSTAILLLICIPLALFLCRLPPELRLPIETVLTLPIVLPPSVLGFYLLLLFSNQGFIGAVAQEYLGLTLAFSFSGLVAGSVVYSLPFVLQPILKGFLTMDSSATSVAATLGMPPWKRIFRVTLPMAREGILTGTVLGFAHTLGEFGVVLMIGGNIPGSTRVISLAIFDFVETMEYQSAHQLSLILVAISCLVLLMVGWINRPKVEGVDS